MSTRAHCEFNETAPGEWYYRIQLWPFGKTEEYASYGPFKTKALAQGNLHASYPNPGAFVVTEFPNCTCGDPYHRTEAPKPPSGGTGGTLAKRYGQARPASTTGTLARAVKAMRLYLGSVDYASLKDQQKLYKRASDLTTKIADSKGMTAADAWAQIMAEAQKQGIVRPRVGQHL